MTPLDGELFINMAITGKHTMRRLIATALLLSLFVAAPAYANWAIPGSLLYFGSSLTVNSLQWVAVCMVMCILVEGAIYKYWGPFGKPFVVSTYLNFVSLFFGIPLIFVGAFDPSWFILPTFVSTLIEVAFGRRLPKRLRADISEKKAASLFF